MAAAAAVATTMGIGCTGIAYDADETLRQPYDQRFEALEARLLDTESLAMEFEITSSGAFESSVQGTLRIDGPDVEISLRGNFGDAEKHAMMHGDTERLIVDTNGPDFERSAPAALREGIILGMTRMGLLHNGFAMAHGGPPERVDGSVREWVQAIHFTDVDSTTEIAPGTTAFAFDLLVGGQPSGTATLHLDSATGLPTQRTQRVDFDSGSMLVEERYRLLP